MFEQKAARSERIVYVRLGRLSSRAAKKTLRRLYFHGGVPRSAALVFSVYSLSSSTVVVRSVSSALSELVGASSNAAPAPTMAFMQPVPVSAFKSSFTSDIEMVR